MKQYKYVILMAAALLFANCSDYLDKYPENKVDVEKVDYAKIEDMFKPVAGVYTVARGASFSFWGQYGLLSVRGDDVNKGSSSSDQGELNFAESFEYNQIGGYWALNSSWENLYNLVLACNAALVSLDGYNKYAITENDKNLNKQYQAEVRFLRAYTYFYITRMWGDVPLILDNAQVQENPGESPRDGIYKFINDELDFCIQTLPAVRPNEMPNKGQVTKYTALALKSKANSDINNWDAVLSATNEVINSGKFSLYPDFYEYFKLAGELSDENLFELQYVVVEGTAYESDAWFAFQGPRNGFVGTKIEGGWGFMTPSPKIEQLFLARNEKVRYKTTFLFAGTTTPEGDQLKPNTAEDKHDRVFNGKAYLPSTQLPEGRTKYGLGNNIRLLRYADVLLLNAEAKVRKGENGDAPFNLVRTRAEMPPLTNVTLDQILEERFVEFTCEWGERYFDLVRTGKAATELSGFKAGESEFYPVPQAQLDLNPNLK